VSSGRELRRRRVPRRVRKAYGARALPRPKEKGDRIRPSHCLSSLVTKATREISSTDSNQRLFRLAYLKSSIISYHFASVHIYDPRNCRCPSGRILHSSAPPSAFVLF
jgi:hypothetical protein